MAASAVATDGAADYAGLGSNLSSVQLRVDGVSEGPSREGGHAIHLLRKRLDVFVCVGRRRSVLQQVHQVGDGFERIVDLMGEFVGLAGASVGSGELAIAFVERGFG